MSHQIKKNLSLLFKPEGVFLLLSILIGGGFTILIPYGAGFDEEQHVIRIYDLAAWNWLPNQHSSTNSALFVPHDFFKYSYQRRFFQTPAFDLLLGRGMRWPLKKTDVVEVSTRSFYSPFNFLPQALVARFFWHEYDFPVVPIAILCRMAGLAIYIVLSSLAIRFLPTGKWVLTVLALAPSALFQASTLNADGFTNAASFLFIAAVLHLSLDLKSILSRRKIILLVFSILLVGVAKPGMIVLFPLLFLVPFQRFPGKKWKLVVGTAVILAVIFAVQYNALAVQSSQFAGSDEGSLSQKVRLIFEHPWSFLYTLLWGNLHAAGNYFTEWIAVYGHWVGSVPVLVYPLFFAALIIALGLEHPPVSLKPLQRWVLGIMFLISSGTFALMYTLNNFTPDNLEGFGHQGRYYIPTAPLLYLALNGLIIFRNPFKKKAPIFLITSIITALALYTLGLYATYYTYCGTTWYTFKGCTQPVYKNIDWSQTPEITLSPSNNSLRQEFPNRCGVIEQIQFYVRAHSTDAKAFLSFSLEDADHNLLYQQQIPLDSLPAMSFINLNVFSQTIGNKIGTSFELVILGNGQVELALNGGDYFREAHLTAHGEEISDDLVFRYTCQPFLKQIIQGVN